MRHVLVTGGLGFLGSHLVDALLRGRCAITVVDNKSSNVVEETAHDGRCRVEVGDVAAYATSVVYDEI